MDLKTTERCMLAAAEKVPLVAPRLKDGQVVIVVSPTRGIQLAQVVLDQYTQRTCLKRIGGPEWVAEEVPDILQDAKPFLVVDWTVDLVQRLQRELADAKEQLDEARNDTQAYRDMRRRVHAQLVTALAERDMARRELELLRSQLRKH